MVSGMETVKEMRVVPALPSVVDESAWVCLMPER
jgi:hypothetical protein